MPGNQTPNMSPVQFSGRGFQRDLQQKGFQYAAVTVMSCAWLAGEEEDEGLDDSEDDSNRSDQKGSEEDTQHEQLLARVSAEGTKRKKHTVVLHEAIMEGQHSVAAAGHDMHADGEGGELGLDDLLRATPVSQADRKALQKLAAGKKVRPAQVALQVACCIEAVMKGEVWHFCIPRQTHSAGESLDHLSLHLYADLPSYWESRMHEYSWDCFTITKSVQSEDSFPDK
jgi:hypothetical protein